MKENTLLKIALICSLVGMVALYFISAKIDLKDYKPPVTDKNIGDDISLKGAVTKITDRGNVVFVEISHQSPVNVVMFAGEGTLQLKRGDNVEVIGKVQQYNGKEEIIAQNVRVIR